jgi:2'-5' RNA ligase
MTGMVRTFLAFDIENKSILEKISQLQFRLKNIGTDIRIVKNQNIHITVRFFGDIQNYLVDMIYQEMKQISFNRFRIELKGVGAFPKPTYPRTIWVGISKGIKELTDIFEQLEPRVRGLGIKADYRGFNPHLTIARVRSGRNKVFLSKLIREMENFDFGPVNLEALRLKKSDLTPKGPIYTTLKEVCGK